MSLQAISSRPNLTLAVPAVIALAAPFLVHHRIAATLRAEIARRLQATQADRRHGIIMPIVAALLRYRRSGGLPGGLLRLQRLQVLLQRSRHRVRQRTYLLHTEADGAAAANAAQLISDLAYAIHLRERSENAQVERDQAAQRLRQRGKVTARLSHIHEHLQRPVLVTIDGDVDLPLRRNHPARIALHHIRARLDALLDRSHR